MIPHTSSGDKQRDGAVRLEIHSFTARRSRTRGTCQGPDLTVCSLMFCNGTVLDLSPVRSVRFAASTYISFDSVALSAIAKVSNPPRTAPATTSIGSYRFAHCCSSSVRSSSRTGKNSRPRENSGALPTCSTPARGGPPPSPEVTDPPAHGRAASCWQL